MGGGGDEGGGGGPPPAASIDLDHALRPTYVDGDWMVLRAPAVSAGRLELREGRVYVLTRRRNRLWQDDSFYGLSDRMNFEP